MPPVAKAVAAQNRSVHVTNKEALRWLDASRPGLRLAPVHENRDTGRFLGLLGFDTMASSGLHQHVDIGLSYVLSGGLTDYSGTTSAGQMGINLPGATHDAIAYQPSLLASRLDGPVLYWPETGREDAPYLHAGGRDGKFTNARPEDPPDISLTLSELPTQTSSIGGVTRKLICDYKGTRHDFRSSALTLIPGTSVPAFQTQAPIDIFMIGGGMKVNGQLVLAGGFCIVEADVTVELSSGFGACFLAWSEAPVRWLDPERADLFGF